MNVFVNSAKRDTRKVEIDDMHHILDIQSASRNSGGNENGRFGGAKGAATVG